MGRTRAPRGRRTRRRGPERPGPQVDGGASAGGRRWNLHRALAGDGRALAVSVGPLATGVYTVRWRVLSATDGHTTSGFLLFGVGERLPAGGAAGTGLIGPPVSQVLVRWVNFAAAMLLAGTVFFEFLILRPLRPRPDTSGVLRAATVTSAAVLLAGLTCGVVLEAGILVRTPVTVGWRRGSP